MPSSAARDAMIPWSRTWMGLAVLAAAIGALYAAIPYSRGTSVVRDEVVTVECASPVLGVWGDDDPPAIVEAGDEIRLGCPSDARERLAVGLALVVLGGAGIIYLRRTRNRRAAAEWDLSTDDDTAGGWDQWAADDPDGPDAPGADHPDATG